MVYIVTTPDYSGALERFANDFETDTSGLVENGGTATIEESGSNGVPSADGNSHARLSESDSGGVFTRLGGYRTSDDLGFVTSVQIYLDTAMAAGEGFDYSVAANQPAGVHLRDFIFHIAKDTSTGNLLVGADNNTNFEPREDLDTTSHAVITTSGWYTFEHKFYQNGLGDLEVTLSVYNAADGLVFSKVLSSTDDDFATDFGGNRYGWFTNIDVTGGIAIDNIQLATLDTNPVQVFVGNTIVGTYATVADAKTAAEGGAISGATLFIETTGADDGFFFVVNGMSIQTAIDAASDGDTIVVGDGTYGAFTVDVANLTIEASGSGAIVAGTFRSDNGIPGGTSVPTFLQTAAAYSGAAGAGVTISANGVTLDGLTITSFNTAVELGSNSGLTLTDVTIDESVNGVRKGTAAVVTDFTMNGGTISDTQYGLNIAAAVGAGAFSGVTIDGTNFENLGEKGIYAEQLSDALITNITMTNVGEFGRGPAFGPASQTGEFGNGIDINLKYGAYENITISNFTFTDVGSSSGVDTVALDFGAAIVIKARDDAPSYSGSPATLDGVTIQDGTIDGTSTGVRIGEPGKNNAGPTSVSITNVTVTDFDVADFENLTQASVGFPGELDLGSGNDGYTADAGDDTVNGGAGEDTATFTGTLTADDFSYDPLTNTWTVNSENEGSDGLVHFEKVVDGNGNTFLLVDLLGSYTTIQSAIDASADGDTLLIAAGVYDEDLNINKAVTLLGAQAGVAGTSGSRSAASGTGETTILGRSEITSAGDVTIDGVRFLNDATTTGGGASAPTLQVTASAAGAEIEITNSIFWSTLAGGANGVDDRAFSTEVLSNTDIDFSNNLISGTSTGGFGTASWGRGIWFDGGDGVDLTITNTIINYARTGVNAEMTGTATVTATGNTFNTNGTAFSGGVDIDGFDASNNAFNAVGTDFNFRNIAGDIVFDLTGDIAAANGSPGDAPVVVLGGNGADTITGSNFADLLDGNNLSAVATDADTLDGAGGNDFLLGKAGDDDLTGGAGTDTLIGGAGTDTANFDDVLTSASFGFVTDSDPFTGGNQAGWSVAGDGGDTLSGVERVVDGAGNVFLLVGNGGFANIQAAIDAASGGETILVAPGSYTENANYNPTNNTNDPGFANPLGLLVNKSVTIVGLDATGAPVTDVGNIAATVVSGAQSGWGTNFFVTAADVTITGLRFEGTGPGYINKAFEVVQGGFVLEDSIVTSVASLPIYSSVYINDESVPGDLTGFVSNIDSYRLDGNVFSSSVVIANGAGLGVVGFAGEITNNVFENTPWVDIVNNDDGNWPLLLNGKVDGVAWLNAAVATPTDVSGNTFDLGANAQILLRLRDQNPADIADAAFVEAYVADNDVGASAYVLTPGGELRLVQAAPGDAFSFYLVPSVDGVMDFTNAYPYGDAIPLAEAGDTVVVDTDGATQNATVTIDNLTFLASDDSNDLNLTLGAGVVSVTLADYGLDAGANVDVAGNGEDNVIAGNSGDNVLSGGLGADVIDGGAGDDDIDGNGGVDEIDGGDGNDNIDGGGGRDTVTFSAGTDYAHGGAGNDTLLLPGAAADYSIVILGAGHYEITRTADGAFTEAVSFENVSFISAVALDAVDDAATIVAGDVRSLLVLANDFGSGTVIAANLVGGGEGTVSVAPGGTGINYDLTTGYLSLDSGQTASVTILYLLSDGSSSDTATVSVTIYGVADPVGAVTDTDLTTNEVNEGLTAGAEVGITAKAKDPDAGSTVTYALTDDADGAFAIDTYTGVVTTARALDREGADGASQTITVEATSTDGTTSSETFTIAINDVSDSGVSATTDVDTDANAVDENAAAETIVHITALATDADVGETVSYSLDDDAGGVFVIDAVTGVVKVGSGVLLNREANASLSITVRSTSTDTSFTTETFTIAVGDVDEFDVTTPVDTVGGAGGAITENAVAGTSVGIIASATDDDATTNTVTYSLVDDDGGRFVIAEATGEVLVGAIATDREQGATRSITVLATSSDGSTAQQTFNITVADVDEFNVTAPVDTDAAADAVANIPVTGGSTGVTASASDGDATNNGVTYSLLAGDDDFDIDTNTGVITVGATFNTGGSSTRLVTVQATSADGSTAQSNFTIAFNGGITTINGTVGKDTINGGAGRQAINGLDSNDTLNGDGDNDIIDGGLGNDIINGGTGADAMTGGAGNDTFYVDNVGDTVNELSGGGTRDIVYSDISITALFAEVEELYLTGAADLNGTGSGSNNKLVGNSGANVLDGSGGNDTLNGLGGNDTLIGGLGVDQLDGGANDDTLNGGAARDSLTGGLGADDFVFDFVPTTASLADRVLDFSSAQGDKIVLSGAGFAAIGATLDLGELVIGTAALDANDYLILEAGTGRLFYDADGNGSGAAQLIVTLDAVTTLAVTDFEI